MFLLEIAIISIIVGLIRKGSIKNFFVGGLRGWYIFLVSIILFMSQKVLALTGVTALNDYAFWITIAAYILLFIGLFLNLEGIWVYALLIGALMNFVIIVLNGGLMPVSESALNIALGDAAATYTSNFAATMSVATDSTIFLWKYLGAIIPLPLPSIFAEVLTPGTIIMAISSFGFIQSIMTTEYMDEDEYEQYMKELSSEDKKDVPLLDEEKEEKYNEKSADADNEIDYTSMDNDDIFDNESNDNSFEDTTENVSLDEELEELSNEEPEEETDYFADFDLEDLRDDDEENDKEDLSEIEEEGAKLEDEDLLKELEDEFNAGEEELFAEDDSLDSLIDDALSEDELDNEQEEEPEEIEEVTEEIEDGDKDDFDLPLEAAAVATGVALAANENTDDNKDSDLEDLLTEALGDDEEDEEIQELLNELRSLSEEDDTNIQDDMEQNKDEQNESLDIIDENEEENNEEIDYDFFKDEDDNEIEEVTNEDLSQTVEYEEDEQQKDMLNDEDEEVSTQEPIVASRNNIQDAKDFLNKVGKQKQEKKSDPVNPMPDVDVDSPFIITDGRIVENPYYKFKKGTTTRKEEAVSSPQIDDNGIYVMSSGELAKVKGGKVQPKIPQKDETKTRVKKTNIPNMTYTPGFDNEEEKTKKEQYTPITTKLEKDEERKSSKISTNDYSSRIPMDNPYDNKQEKQSKPKRQYRRYTPTSEQLDREPNMTIINDSSTGRTIKRDSKYPREEILPTYKDSVIDEKGKEVTNPYEKVEMKIGDVEIKFWKKDNQ